MNENKISTSNIAVSIFLGGIGTFVALLIAALAAYIFIDISFLSNTGCNKGKDYVYCFFEKEWDSGTYLSTITSFYSTVITILIALLGVVAGFAIFVIRGSTLERGDEVIEKEVDRYFETDKAKAKISDSAEKFRDAELEEIKGTLDEIRVALIEAEIMKDGNLEVGNEKKAD